MGKAVCKTTNKSKHTKTKLGSIVFSLNKKWETTNQMDSLIMAEVNQLDVSIQTTDELETPVVKPDTQKLIQVLVSILTVRNVVHHLPIANVMEEFNLRKQITIID